MIQTVFISYLLADEELDELVEGRVYPMRLPQRESLPAIVYQVIANTPENTLEGDRNVGSVSVQFTCWSKTYAEAQQVAAELRRVMGTIKVLHPTTGLILDGEDPDTKALGVISTFELWDGAPSPDGFRYASSNGDIDRHGVTLASAIVTDGFYMVFKNGSVMKEGAGNGFTLNVARDRVIFEEQLGIGEDLDEVLVIFQAAEGPAFERVEFNGTDNPNGITLDPAMMEDGFHSMALNGTFSKEGDRYEIDPSLAEVVFLEALQSDDEGIFTYQTTSTPMFEKVPFDADSAPNSVSLPSAIIDGGLYMVVINGRITKEGVTGRFTVSAGRDTILFNQPLETGDDKDEGIVIYQIS